MTSLRPPLPPPLSHDGITFVPCLEALTDETKASARLPNEIVAAIARTLHDQLPSIDIVSASDGQLHHVRGDESVWGSTARLEGIQRSLR